VSAFRNFAFSALVPAAFRRFPTDQIQAGPRIFLSHTRVPEVTKLYVGNLPFSATEETVRTAFSAHGTVESLSLVMDRDTGQPRGFGFVEMSSADASRAMQALNGADFGGRPLKVNEAQDRPRAGGGGGGRGPRRN
jgi:RNA recognition motif-containing protein